ncbi:MAG: MFS transporter [Chloroflexi bacterium]|nr:MFS transporter [Chloroflexota bacterium]MCI0574774.1 MFS transporter [Chloroflexota bacterium]MCI0646413.1 MFS transporter [Chloroflexota bacterium]MCI0725514.1 MFS transporter [Chloroflexota bacterium]
MSETSVNKSGSRAIYLLFTANTISLIGNQLTLVAIPWFVLETTASAAQTGLTAFFHILPIVIAGFLGGTVVDRLGYKRMSIVADIASGITVAFVPLLFGLGLLPFWMLLVLVFLGALLDAPGSTARAALVPELAEAAKMPLERASSLLQIVERASRLVGAPLAGLLVAVMGAQNVLWLDAATFAISAAMVAFLIPAAQTVTPIIRQRYTSDLAEGLRFLRQDRLLLVIVGAVMITNFLDAAKGSVILPVYARDVYDSAVALGLMFGLSGGGAVLSALVYGIVGHKYSRRWTFVGAFIAVSLPIFILAALPPLPVVLLAQFVSGIAAGPINPVISTVEYERIPPNMRGRVFGTITAGAWMAMPLGVLLGGYAIEWAGLVPTLLVVGGCYLLTTVSLAFHPVLKLMDVPSVA